MKACCTKCKTTTPTPIPCPLNFPGVDTITAFWFLLDKTGDSFHMDLDENGVLDYNFKVSNDASLEVEEEDSSLVYCPQCMQELIDEEDDHEQEA